MSLAAWAVVAWYAVGIAVVAIALIRLRPASYGGSLAAWVAFGFLCVAIATIAPVAIAWIAVGAAHDAVRYASGWRRPSAARVRRRPGR